MLPALPVQVAGQNADCTCLKRMKLCRYISLVLGTVVALIAANRAVAANPDMDAFVSDLLARMTVEEKIGQLNLLSTGFDVTGPVANRDVEASVRKGKAGGVFNFY